MRPLEAAYVRAVLSRRVHEDVDREPGLTPDALQQLRDMGGDALDVERRGRVAHLWRRAATQLPRSVAGARRRLSSEALRQVQDRFVDVELWRFERTVDAGVYGQGHEVATPVRAALRALAVRSPWNALLADLADFEWARFSLPWQGLARTDDVYLSGRSRFSFLEEAQAERLEDLLRPTRWTLRCDGKVLLATWEEPDVG